MAGVLRPSHTRSYKGATLGIIRMSEERDHAKGSEVVGISARGFRCENGHGTPFMPTWSIMNETCDWRL